MLLTHLTDELAQDLRTLARLMPNERSQLGAPLGELATVLPVLARDSPFVTADCAFAEALALTAALLSALRITGAAPSRRIAGLEHRLQILFDAGAAVPRDHRRPRRRLNLGVRRRRSSRGMRPVRARAYG